jgi:hypothetical protein
VRNPTRSSAVISRAPLFYSNERGNLENQLCEITEAEANRIVELIGRSVSGQPSTSTAWSSPPPCPGIGIKVLPRSCDLIGVMNSTMQGAALREHPSGRQRAWLLGTLAHKDISDLRRRAAFRRRQPEIHARYTATAAANEAQALNAIALARAREIIDGMPPRQRQIALMRWRDRMRPPKWTRCPIRFLRDHLTETLRSMIHHQVN